MTSSLLCPLFSLYGLLGLQNRRDDKFSSLSFFFTLWSLGTAKSTWWQVLFSFLYFQSMVFLDCKINVMTSSLIFPLFSLYGLLGLQNPRGGKFSSLSFIFTLWSAGNAKSTWLQVLFSFLYFHTMVCWDCKIHVMKSSLLFLLFSLYGLLGLQNPRGGMFSSLSFIFTLWSAGTAKSTWWPVLFSVLYFHSVVCWDCKIDVMTGSLLFFLFSLYGLLGLQNRRDDKFSSLSFIFTLWSAGTAKSTWWKVLFSFTLWSAWTAKSTWWHVHSSFLYFHSMVCRDCKIHVITKSTWWQVLFSFLYFHSMVSWDGKIHVMTSSLLFPFFSFNGLLGLQNPRDDKFYSLSFIFTVWSAWTAKSTWWQVLFSFLYFLSIFCYDCKIHVMKSFLLFPLFSLYGLLGLQSPRDDKFSSPSFIFTRWSAGTAKSMWWQVLFSFLYFHCMVSWDCKIDVMTRSLLFPLFSLYGLSDCKIDVMISSLLFPLFSLDCLLGLQNPRGGKFSSLSFIFSLWSAGTAKSTWWHVLFSFLYFHCMVRWECKINVITSSLLFPLFSLYGLLGLESPRDDKFSSLCFIFTLWSAGTAKSTWWPVLFSVLYFHSMVCWDCKIHVMTSSLLFVLFSLYGLLGLLNPCDDQFSSLSFIFTLWSAGTAKSMWWQVLFSFLFFHAMVSWDCKIDMMTSSLLFVLFSLYGLLGLQNPRDDKFSSLSFIFTLWSAGTAKSTWWNVLFSFLYFHSMVCWDCKVHVMTSSLLFPLFSLDGLLGLQNRRDDMFSSLSFIFTLWSLGLQNRRDDKFSSLSFIFSVFSAGTAKSTWWKVFFSFLYFHCMVCWDCKIHVMTSSLLFPLFSLDGLLELQNPRGGKFSSLSFIFSLWSAGTAKSTWLKVLFFFPLFSLYDLLGMPNPRDYKFSFLFFIFTLWSAGTTKSTWWQVLFSFLYFLSIFCYDCKIDMMTSSLPFPLIHCMVCWECKINVITSSLLFPLFSLYGLLGLESPCDDKFSSLCFIFTLWSLGLLNPRDDQFSSLSFIFTLWSVGTAKSTWWQVLFSFLFFHAMVSWDCKIDVMTSSLLFPLFSLYGLLGLQNPRGGKFSSLSFIFTLWSAGNAKSTWLQVLFSFLYFHTIVCWDCKIHVMKSSLLFPLFSLYGLLGLQNPRGGKFSSLSFIFTLLSAGTAKSTWWPVLFFVLYFHSVVCWDCKIDVMTSSLLFFLFSLYGLLGLQNRRDEKFSSLSLYGLLGLQNLRDDTFTPLSFIFILWSAGTAKSTW